MTSDFHNVQLSKTLNHETSDDITQEFSQTQESTRKREMWYSLGAAHLTGKTLPYIILHQVLGPFHFTKRTWNIIFFFMFYDVCAPRFI